MLLRRSTGNGAADPFWALPVLGGAYLLFALVVTMAGRFPELGQLLPDWLIEPFNPKDKTNLAPYRFVHFVFIVFLVIRFVPHDWHVLERLAAWPLIVCGQQSLEVFCVGVFLSFTAHFILIEVSNTIPGANPSQPGRVGANDRRRRISVVIEEGGQGKAVDGPDVTGRRAFRWRSHSCLVRGRSRSPSSYGGSDWRD